MECIYKYPLTPGASAEPEMIEMPAGAAVLTVQAQRNIPCLWVRVDPNKPKIKRCFITYGTGFNLNDGPARHYVGTYQLDDGAFVFHVYTDRIEFPLDS